MIIRSLRPPALRTKGARYISVQRDPLRKKSSTPPRPPSNPPPSKPRAASSQPPDSASDAPKLPSVSETLAGADPAHSNLLAPVYIPEDEGAIIKSQHPATKLLANSGLVVQRQIEMMNLFLGFEQANRYVIMDPQGNLVGYMAEHDGGFGKAMGRQWFRTHRAFTTHVFDREQNEVLRFHRPFSWINSRIRVYDPLETNSDYSGSTSPSTSLSTTSPPPDPEAARKISTLPLDAMRIIGEAHSEWAPLRRKYNLFLSHNPPTASGTPPISEPVPSDISSLQKTQVQRQNPSTGPSFIQFAYINEPFLSWDFSLLSASNQLIGSVNRNFAGFAREIFTDTGVYALRMDSAGLEEEAARHSSGVERAAKMGIGHRAYQETVGGSGDKIGMTLDQRAVMLATAVTVDFDYFSRHSNAGGVGWMPFMWGGGGEAAGGAAGGAAGAGAGAAGAGEVAGAAGATGVGEAAGGAVLGGAGRAAGGAATGVGEGTMAGAGTMAGYEAMQRGMGRGAEGQGAGGEVSGQEQGGNLPGYGDEYGQGGFPEGQGPQQFGNEGEGQDLWGSGDNDPWSGGGDGGGIGGGGGGGEGGGGGFLAWLWSLFFGE